MSDKKKAIVQIFTTGAPLNIESLIERGYSTHLVFREENENPFLIFDSITGIS